MASTGVSNLLLVRRLLRESHGDKDNVVELLIQWMADDPDNPGQWWETDGPADYAGPPVPQLTAAKTGKLDETVVLETADDAATLADDRSLSKCSTIVEESKKEEPDATATQSPLADDQPVDKETDDQGQHPNAPQDRKKPVKGAARQKKAESKKRQKEMAKMKKRKAAREAAGSAKGTDGPGRSDEEAALELSRQISHIYI